MMVNWYERLAVCPLLVTCAVTLNVPAALGVPLTMPALESETPAGQDPEAVVQL
jgi:hypothetical protein